MGGISNALLNTSNAATAASSQISLMLIGNSIVLGIALMSIVFWSAKRLNNTRDPESELVMGASNYLFLTIGMTVVMLLVANNLARAFAIGAAISLMRLRIKLDGKGQGSAFFFAALIGMACGVEQLEVAYGLTAIFAILQILITSTVSKLQAVEPPPAPEVSTVVNQVTSSHTQQPTNVASLTAVPSSSH